MKVFTIGFTKKSAREFFDKLRRPGLIRLLDVRLNNVSQLAGFTKRDDLLFFCRAILSIEYLHLPELAPTQLMLDEYKKNAGDWFDYEAKFLALMSERKVEDNIASAVKIIHRLNVLLRVWPRSRAGCDGRAAQQLRLVAFPPVRTRSGNREP